MSKKDVIKGLKGTIQDTVNSVKASVKDVKLPEIKVPEIKVAQVRDIFRKKEKEEVSASASSSSQITNISVINAIEIIYYLMAADGQIYHSEEEKFDSIGLELDPEFFQHKDEIISVCQSQIDKVINPEDYYDVLQDGIYEALISPVKHHETFISPKHLVWNLLTIAYSDENYDETERKLLKYIVRKTDIDKTVFLEMESSILTLIDLEKELAWIKTTDRPYLTIEKMVKEITDRKNVIFESVKDLIAL